MVELPFRSPLQFEAACFCENDEGRTEAGHWFVFAGDKLLVELGPPERPSDDPRFRARPAYARLPLRKNHNHWGCEPARTLYLGRLNGVDCFAAELPAQTAAPAGLAWEGLRPLRHADRAEARGARARLPGLQAFGLPARRSRRDGARS